MFDNASIRFGRLGRAASIIAIAALLAATAAADEPPAAPGNLSAELVKNAPDVIKYLRDHGYQSVGVLKFRIKKESEKPTDHAGTLNLDIAQRLEMALLLANNAVDPLLIVHAASAVAAKTPGANHLTPEGRKALFTAKYPLAWGDRQLTPDVMLTGAVKVDAGWQQLTVGIEAFDKEGVALDEVVRFTATPEVDDLVATGESFTRGVFDKGKTQEVAAAAGDNARQQIKLAVVKSAVKVRHSEKPADNPLHAPNAPIGLEVRYDGQPIPIYIQNGKAFLAEPQQGQKVDMFLKRSHPDDTHRYAVVLKVNGENTLGRQRLKEIDCHKWVLDPGDPPIHIRGYQVTGKNEAEEFRVLSQGESKEREMDYGRDVGTIGLTVFQEAAADEPPATAPPDFKDNQAEDFAILERGTFPTRPAADPRGLRSQLANSLPPPPKRGGLIVEGERIAAGIQATEFRADPVPVMAATIIYYKAETANSK